MGLHLRGQIQRNKRQSAVFYSFLLSSASSCEKQRVLARICASHVLGFQGKGGNLANSAKICVWARFVPLGLSPYAPPGEVAKFGHKRAAFRKRRAIVFVIVVFVIFQPARPDMLPSCGLQRRCCSRSPTQGTKRGQVIHCRGLFTVEIPCIFRISKLSRKWSDSPSFLAVWMLFMGSPAKNPCAMNPTPKGTFLGRKWIPARLSPNFARLSATLHDLLVGLLDAAPHGPRAQPVVTPASPVHGSLCHFGVFPQCYSMFHGEFGFQDPQNNRNACKTMENPTRPQLARSASNWTKITKKKNKGEMPEGQIDPISRGDTELLFLATPPVRLGLSGGNSGKTPERPRETLSERFLEFPSRVRLGCPKPCNLRHFKAPEHFQNSLPPSTAGDASFFRSGSGEGLSEPVMEFPAVLGVS